MRVNGSLDQVHFTEGQEVQKGVLLFTIDPRPFQADMLRAEANLARDTAQLTQAQANVAKDQANALNAGIEKRRYQALVEKGVSARQQLDEATATADALYQGCLIRFRPIMMTTMSALMGSMPIALGFGTGAESRRPLGLAVVGGLIFSQLLTLYSTPVVYTYMEAFQSIVRERLRGGRWHAAPTTSG